MVSPGIMADGDSKSLSLFAFLLFVLTTGKYFTSVFLSANINTMCFFDVYFNGLKSIYAKLDMFSSRLVLFT